ncbi:MAG: copper homeostasis protein CutC [Bacteroidia bacterium]
MYIYHMSESGNYILEIAAFSAEAAIIAAEAGADRIELCSAYEAGGLTPTAGTLKFVKAHTQIPVYVMIRPRGGDFCYTDDEIAIMIHDIHELKNCGADGFVAGALTGDGHVHVQQVEQLLHAASPLPFTFHRAFDVCVDQMAALEKLKAIGVQRILSSGGKRSAFEGMQQLAALQKSAAKEIIIMPGAGIHPENLEIIRKTTGCREFHASAKSAAAANDAFGFGVHILPDPELIRQMKRTLSL